MSGDTGQSNDRPFLDLFPIPQRSTVANAFLAAPRDAVATIDGVITYVREHQGARLEHYRQWQNEAGIERASYLLSMLDDHPDLAEGLAQWALHWASLPRAMREAIKRQRRDGFAHRYMETQAPTERQTAYLRVLGHVGPISSKAEASALIDRLAARR